MLHRLVVGLTDSPFSQAAAGAAIVWAQRTDAEVVGVCAIDVDELTAAEPVSIGGSAFKSQRDQALVQQAEAAAVQRLEAFRGDCQQKGLRCHVVKQMGNPATVLTIAAQRSDLLLVGRKRIPAGDDPGSATIQHVLRNACRPVVSVPDGGIDHGRPVLIAYDGSLQAARTLQMFQALGLAKGRLNHLLSVAHENGAGSPAELAADYLRVHGHQVELHHIVSQTPPGQAILTESERMQAGLIVMGCYGRARVTEWIFGSVTQTVLESSTLPLFLYH